MQKIKDTCKNIKRTYNRKMAERKVKNDERRRQKTAIYKFKVIKKMKELHNFCLDETYDIDLRKMYIETLNNVLIKKIIGLNTSIEVTFKFTINKEEVEDQYVDPFIIFVQDAINNYNLEELKLINRNVSKYLK